MFRYDVRVWRDYEWLSLAGRSKSNDPLVIASLVGEALGDPPGAYEMINHSPIGDNGNDGWFIEQRSDRGHLSTITAILVELTENEDIRSEL